MLKSWMAALVTALLLSSPALAQSVKTDVVTKSGGIVVKKVIKNGEVVDEDVEVFGNIDDETRDRILGMFKAWKPGDGKKKARKATKKLEKKKGKGCACCRGGAWIVGPDDKNHHVFSFGPGVAFHLDDGSFPFGEEIKKHLEKALKGQKRGPIPMHPGQGGLHLHLGPHGLHGIGEQVHKHIEKALKAHGLGAHGFVAPDDLEDHVKIFTPKNLPGLTFPFKGDKARGGWFSFPGMGKDVDVKGKARIRIDVNGETVLDKEVDAGQGPNTARFFKFGEKKMDTARSNPKVRILRAPKAEKRPRRSTGGDASIQRLERTIERLQRELKQLKREIGSVRSVELKPTRAKTRIL